MPAATPDVDESTTYILYHKGVAMLGEEVGRQQRLIGSRNPHSQLLNDTVPLLRTGCLRLQNGALQQADNDNETEDAGHRFIDPRGR
ncbi:MAG TPA: hypothetical protein EYQ31_03705 [Candidatus Handelsmanbacteria bacterium]|nr:hypothetical protein [Candidatus Handelsmanbacteria bacterium]